MKSVRMYTGVLLLALTLSCQTDIRAASVHYQTHNDSRSLKQIVKALQLGQSRLEIERMLGMSHEYPGPEGSLTYTTSDGPLGGGMYILRIDLGVYQQVTNWIWSVVDE